jgi:hypothetical protein
MSNTFYTSPHTGKVYRCEVNTEWRQNWDANGNAFKDYYNTYSYFEGDKFVTKTLYNDDKSLSTTFGVLEGVYAPWSTSPRD